VPDIRINEGYRRFRKALQDGQLQAGMTVTQKELCDLLGLSLSPLRETLVLLEEFGLVEIRQRTGIHIVYPELAFIRENMQFRILIETQAIKVFAGMVTEAWLADVRSRHEACRVELLAADLTDTALDSFVSVDRYMHRSFVEALENRAILVTHSRLQDNLMLARRVHQRRTFKNQLMQSIDEHLRIVDSLAQHDASGALEHLEAHFQASTFRTYAAAS
jgi:GntR family transcriptional regulator, rspAB operon transcriptional repressor